MLLKWRISTRVTTNSATQSERCGGSNGGRSAVSVAKSMSMNDSPCSGDIGGRGGGFSGFPADSAAAEVRSSDGIAESDLRVKVSER